MTTSKPEPRYGIKDARDVFPSLVARAAEGERIVLTFHGFDRCAIVPMEDLAKLVEIDARKSGKRRQ